MANDCVALNHETLDVEAVVTLENLGPYILLRELESRTKIGDHCALAVGRHKRQAPSRAVATVGNVGFDAEVLECLLIEVAS